MLPLKGVGVSPDTHHETVDDIGHWTDRAELLGCLQLGTSKFHAWKQRYGHVNEDNGFSRSGRLMVLPRGMPRSVTKRRSARAQRIPRDHWLEDWERRAIVDYHDRNPLEGYRRLLC